MKKKTLYGISVAVILLASGLGYYFGLYLPSQATDGDIEMSGLPEGAAPDGYLILNDVDGEKLVNISLSTLVEMLRNDSIPLSECELDWGNLAGFNPLDLLHYYELNYINEFTLIASDGFARTVDYEKFYMGDPNYYKDAIGEFSMIAIAINQTWLYEIDENFGNFRAYGSLLSSEQKVKNIVNITAQSNLLIDIYINEEISFSLSHENLTNFLGANYTEYAWGYTDNNSDTSWARASLEGTTIASIADYAGISGGLYNVSFISIDGWGSRWVYNSTQMEEGLTGKMINDPAENLSNEGKQTILNIIEDNENLDYKDGPFRIIMPGQTRDRYQKSVVEIRFFV